jgi:hypothetical protein
MTPPPPRVRQHPHPPARKTAVSRSQGTVLPSPSPLSLEEASLSVLPDASSPSSVNENAQRWTKTRHKWSVGYSNPDTLRQMIVATEVLGAPLALRKPRSIPF